MMPSRRNVLKGLAACAGSSFLGAPHLSQALLGAAAPAAVPKRFVFFLQNQNFSPIHAQPVELQKEKAPERVDSQDLTKLHLAPWLDPLEPIKDRVTILQGLNGTHVAPYHGSPYGALGGFRKHPARPAGQTIDCALAQAFPAVVPLLGFGWDDLPRMHASPVDYAPSAWGADRPAPVYLDPELAFNNIFGVASEGGSRKEFEVEASLYQFMREDVGRLQAKLPEAEKAKYQPYLDSFVVNGERRKRLLAMASTLKKHAPKLTDKIRAPRHECDWFDATVDIAVAALIAGVTNVVTFSSGMCYANSGFWHGLNLKAQGHGLGHTSPESPDWLILRRHNMQRCCALCAPSKPCRKAKAR